MDWMEWVVHTTTAAADAVSDLLIRAGSTGTMVEDRADIPDPEHPNGYWEIIDPALIEAMPEDVLVHGWFEPGPELPDTLAALKADLEQLRGRIACDPGTLAVDTLQVHDQDWSEVWKQFYKPFRAGKTLVVKPTWETWDAQPGDRVIELDPGMAFGSGTHETTGLCLALLEETLQGGEAVIDVGTGSGILAIGAALLGARDVLAIDIDPDAVRVAEENVAHNGLQDRVRVVRGNLLDKQDAVCEVCVANIIADVICAFAEPLRQHIAPGGWFICSGILLTREEEVVRRLEETGYRITDIRRRGEWVAIRSRRGE